MRPQATGVWFYIPANFRVEALDPDLHRLRDEFHWLVHRVITQHAQYRHSGDEFTSISRRTMEDFIQPKEVTRVLTALLRSGVIESDGEWVPRHADPTGRGKSTGYRIAGRFVGKLRRVECTKRSLAAKVLVRRIKVLDQPVKEESLTEVCRHLLFWLRQVKIDLDRAIDIIDAQPQSSTRRKRSARRRKRVRTKAYRELAQHINRMSAETIAAKEFDLCVCAYGRVHTNITRLLTEVRECLSIDGKPLVNIDIKNSQMVFFTILLLEERLGHTSLQYDSISSSTATTPLRTILSDPSVLAEDEREFVILAINGNLYEYLMEHYNEHNPRPIRDRKTFKQKLFCTVFYGDNDSTYSRISPLARLFRERFPNVWDFIREQKVNGYAQLAQAMQRRESTFVIHTVCNHLMKHHPHIPLITIHDSIMTTEPHVDSVRRIILREFERLGVGAGVHVERSPAAPIPDLSPTHPPAAA